MKKLLLPVFLIFFTSVSAQKKLSVEQASDHSVHIKGNNFDGVVFRSSYLAVYPIEKNAQKYTPSTDEILLAERILSKSLDTVKYYGHEYFVRKNLKKYVRQYFGYINQSGDKVIYISALWKRSINYKEGKWLNEQLGVLDGGDYYWQIKINITAKKSFDFQVNGQG